MKKYIVPLAIFAAIGGLLMYALYLSVTGGYSPRDIPSPFKGKSLPILSLPTLHEPDRIVSSETFRGHVYLLNAWGSWCPACRQEHQMLNEIARTKVVLIVGLNFKDKRIDALRWLDTLGNPYQTILFDESGRSAIDVGVYGAPETFVIDKNGIVREKHIGPITPEVWEKKLAPLIKELS